MAAIRECLDFYINGQWVDSDDRSTFSVANPATGESIADVASCGTAETRRAIEAAEAAMTGWRKRSAKERAAILRKWFTLMMDAQDDLAQIRARRRLATIGPEQCGELLAVHPVAAHGHVGQQLVRALRLEQQGGKDAACSFHGEFIFIEKGF